MSVELRRAYLWIGLGLTTLAAVCFGAAV